MKESTRDILASSIASTCLKCPSCKKAGIFHNLLKLKLKNSCDNCGLCLEDFDVGDGPAYFGIFIVGFLIPIFAIIVEVYFYPSLLVHCLIWIPATIVLCYIVLIYSRSMFIWVEYKIRELNK